MIFALLAAFSAGAASPASLLDQAFRGRDGSRWSGTVLVERPGKDAPDTAQACREGKSERLDFRDGALWMAGDSSVFLRNRERVAVVHSRFRMPPPPPQDGNVKVVGRAKVLGRTVVVMDVAGPGGRERRVWVDTSLPAVLKGEPVRKGDHPGPERQFLSIRPGVGCAPNAFRVPAGWTVRKGGGPPEGGEERGHGRRHEAASLAEVVAAVGFEPPPPPWLPDGFRPWNWAWVETREGKAAQIFYSDGTRNISVFWRSEVGAPPYCPHEGCRDRKGRAVFFGHVGRMGLAVTGDLPAPDLERVAGLRR